MKEVLIFHAGLMTMICGYALISESSCPAWAGPWFAFWLLVVPAIVITSWQKEGMTAEKGDWDYESLFSSFVKAAGNVLKFWAILIISSLVIGWVLLSALTPPDYLLTLNLIYEHNPKQKPEMEAGWPAATLGQRLLPDRAPCWYHVLTTYRLGV
jgi:hypothetical protein